VKAATKRALWVGGILAGVATVVGVAVATSKPASSTPTPPPPPPPSGGGGGPPPPPPPPQPTTTALALTQGDNYVATLTATNPATMMSLSDFVYQMNAWLPGALSIISSTQPAPNQLQVKFTYNGPTTSVDVPLLPGYSLDLQDLGPAAAVGGVRQPPPAAPQTYSVGQADNGTTLSVHVGDSIIVGLTFDPSSEKYVPVRHNGPGAGLLNGQAPRITRSTTPGLSAFVQVFAVAKIGTTKIAYNLVDAANGAVVGTFAVTVSVS